MFRLTREVRFAINSTPDDQLAGRASNSFAGFPSLTGLGHQFALQVTLVGELQEKSSYLLNIKDIDRVVRESAIPLVGKIISANEFRGGAHVAVRLFDLLSKAWPGASVDAMRFALSPTLSFSVAAKEHPMVRLSQKFEFSASHRLHSPELSDEENRRIFGKCNNPNGHGHNYELQVTLLGKPDSRGVIMEIPAFERIVADAVVEPFDHKNLNVEVPQFKDVMPSVENIAMVIFGMLKPKFAAAGGKLASVTVWETPKTWCEYSE